MDGERDARWYTRAVSIALLVGSCLVLAFADLLDLPLPVVLAALLVASVAAVLVVINSLRRSHREGIGLLRAIGRSIRDLGKFIINFF